MVDSQHSDLIDPASIDFSQLPDMQLQPPVCTFLTHGSSGSAEGPGGAGAVAGAGAGAGPASNNPKSKPPFSEEISLNAAVLCGQKLTDKDVISLTFLLVEVLELVQNTNWSANLHNFLLLWPAVLMQNCLSHWYFSAYWLSYLKPRC